MSEPIMGNPITTPMKVSDWNQNDPKKSDYVKNRTHYMEESAELIYIEFTLEETSSVDGDDFIFIQLDTPLIENAEYYYEASFGKGTFIPTPMEGDTSKLDIQLGEFKGWYAKSRKTIRINIGYDTEGYIRICEMPIYHKLDEHFIPDSIATKEYVKEYVDENSGSLPGMAEMDYEYVDTKVAEVKQYVDDTVGIVNNELESILAGGVD